MVGGPGRLAPTQSAPSQMAQKVSPRDLEIRRWRVSELGTVCEEFELQKARYQAHRGWRF
jgi:hypothetical protein